jgi:uncharacterized protein
MDAGELNMKQENANMPFIKKFTNAGYYYVYDVNTNQMVEVEKDVYDVIDEYRDDYKDTKHITNEQRKSYEKIETASKEHGLFSTFRPKKVTMGIRTASHVRELHKNGLNQLLLEVTKDCNLKCRYCPVSGKYSKPCSGDENMSRDTCQKAVDFFLRQPSNSRRPFISFYGGEPLIRFDFIKETVQYVKKKYAADKVNFSLTTNATLLNKEIVDFFIENNFAVSVSLDGPERVNDRYRIFGNGKGTFRRIMRNLEFIKNYNPEYYSRKVSILSVFAPPYDMLDEILDFFNSNEVIKPIKSKIRSSRVSSRATSFLDDFGLKESVSQLSSVDDILLKRLKESILANDFSRLTIEKRRIFIILYNLARRTMNRLHEYIPPLGACHLGLRRVFVDTGGDFFVCERGEHEYKIGCLSTGFDYEKIAGYYRALEDVCEDCRNCWAQLHCERCWVSIGNLDSFPGKRKERFCAINKELIEKAFKVYAELLREKPDSLEVFKDVIIA